jgi:hypothetical protein
MSAILADYFAEFEPTGVQPTSRPKSNALPGKTGKTRPAKTDLHFWLSNNAPREVEELKALRYMLYHRCNRANFKVSEKKDKDDFMLSGRQTSVRIVSNKARRYLLWKLRILARGQGWVRRQQIRLIADSGGSRSIGDPILQSGPR